MKQLDKVFAAATCGLVALGLAMLASQWTPSSHGQPLLAQKDSAAATPATGNNDNNNLDHFKCYKTNLLGSNPYASVTLRDQFGESTVTVKNDLAFCNPTKKIHNGMTRIQNRKGHLTWYEIIGPAPPPQVTVHNQFGLQTLYLQRAFALAVPTQKLPLRQPRGLDHFLCYGAGTGPPGASVTLEDQFGRDTFTVGFPFAFCNPVRKTHNGVVTPIRNEEGHLTCYDIQPLLNEARTLNVRNQFGAQQTLYTLSTKALCAPSIKCPPPDDNDNDGLTNFNEGLFRTLLNNPDSDGDGIVDGNDDSNRNGVDDEDEDDNDRCPDRDSDGDGIDDEDEDD